MRKGKMRCNLRACGCLAEAARPPAASRERRSSRTRRRVLSIPGRMKSAALTPALPLAPLVAMCTALGFLALPLWDHAAAWAMVVFLLGLVARIVLGRFAISLPPAWLKLSLLTVAMGIMLASYGT